MRKSVKFFMLALVAVIGAAFTSSSAMADITASPAGNITATSLGQVGLIGEGGLIDITLNCDVTLGGTLASSISDTAGAHVGAITGGSARNCDNGSAALLFGSPSTWELTLTRIDLAGTLATLLVNDAQFSVTVLGTTCLYAGDVPISLDFSGSNPNYRTGLITVLDHTLPLASGGFLCPTTGILDATFALSPQQTLALV